jgi:hypothetical protein
MGVLFWLFGIAASWFETRGFAALLTMRVWQMRVCRRAPDLIPRSGHLAAARGMAAGPDVASILHALWEGAKRRLEE